jgi:short-subunit dehydrogenase involved in D-alanine esterification of teichoic acids
MDLSNNTILITGGTSGTGLELGKVFLTKNNKVVLLGRSKEKVKELEALGFETILCDLSNQQDIENAVMTIQNKYPDINMLFNNAGIQNNYLFTDTIIPIDKINQEISVNTSGQIVFTHLLLTLLANKKKAYIINTTSALGIFPKPDGLVYSASKAAMRNFTIGLRYALKKTNIKVLEIIPPVTDTAMTTGRDEDKMDVEKLIQVIIPQLKKDKSVITVKKIKLFFWIAFLFPGLANKIFSK